MVLNARSVGILIRLVDSHSYVSAKELAQKMGVSRRTIFSDVENINLWLEDHQLAAAQYHPSAGFYFEHAGKVLIKERLGELNLDRQYKNSRGERVAWVGILLLTREQTIFPNDLTEKFTMSKSTIQRDLKLLAEILLPFRLKLVYSRQEGYSISGDEQNKRKVLIHFLSKLHPHRETHWIIQNTHSSREWRSDLVAPPHALKIHKIILDSQKYLNVRYLEDVIELLSIQLLLLLSRYKQGKVISLDPVEKVVVKPSPEFQASSFIGEKVKETFGVDIPDDELCYITICLMAAKNQHPLANSSEEDMDILKSVIHEMVDQFQKEAGVMFKTRDALERSLFFHLKSAYYRIVHGQMYDNPLTDMIKGNYPDLFHKTKKVISHLEDVMGDEIPDDELALITMHFGGWIEKES